MDPLRPWHQLFGLSLTDFFRGQPVTVEIEKDLSLKKQLLDVVLIRKQPGVLTCPLPDGFEDLADYNSVSFKSHRETLSAFALEELLGHYVNLRKQVSPSMHESDLLDPNAFRLFAVCARLPRNLADDGVVLRPLQEGVYEVAALSRRIRVIVVNQLSQKENNALLHLFSTNFERFAYGARHYQIRSVQTSTLLVRLFQWYQQEVHAMPDALEEFSRQVIDELLRDMPIQKRLEGVSTEKRLEGVSVDQLLAALSPQLRAALAERLKGTDSAAKPE